MDKVFETILNNNYINGYFKDIKLSTFMTISDGISHVTHMKIGISDTDKAECNSGSVINFCAICNCFSAKLRLNLGSLTTLV